MRSKITVDLGENNAPVLRVSLSRETTDLPDKVLKQFFEKLGYNSKWLKVEYLNWDSKSEYIDKLYEISPVEEFQIIEVSKEMLSSVAAPVEAKTAEISAKAIADKMEKLAQEYATLRGQAVVIEYSDHARVRFDPEVI